MDNEFTFFDDFLKEQLESQTRPIVDAWYRRIIAAIRHADQSVKPDVVVEQRQEGGR